MSRTRAQLVQAQTHTESARDLLPVVQQGRLIWNATANSPQMYDGSKWVDVLNSDASIPGDSITGDIDAAQLDGTIDGGQF